MADLWFPNPFPIGQPAPYAPGTILPYTLPNFDVEPPFEKISWHAVEEAEKFGPLNAEKMIDFLKFVSSSDYKKPKIKVAVKEALGSNSTNDSKLKEFYMQLYNVRSRINQVEDVEKERTDFIHDRIESVEEGMSSEKPPDQLGYDLILSKVAEEALRRAENKGPLRKIDLVILIRSGKVDRKLRSQKLEKQLKDLRESIGHIAKRENQLLESIRKVISKALEHIDTELINANIL